MTGRSVPEWIGKTPDTPIPPRVHLRVRDRDDSRCAHCTRVEKRGQADHICALINGGQNRERNLQWLCTTCHRLKTAEDVAVKAKTHRVRVKDAGLRKPSRGFRGWRKFNGEPVYRRTTTGPDRNAQEKIEGDGR